MWGRKGQELAWDDPVHVTVLDSLIELVFSDVEGLDVEPAEFYAELEPSEAIEDCALVGAGKVGRVSEGAEWRLSVREWGPGLFCGAFKGNDLSFKLVKYT